MIFLLTAISELPIFPLIIINLILSQVIELSVTSSIYLVILTLLPFITTYSLGCFIDAAYLNFKLFSKYLGIASFLLFYTYDDHILKLISFLQDASFLELTKLMARSIEITSLCAIVLMLINLTIEMTLRLLQRGSSSSIRFSYPAIRIFLIVLIFSITFEVFADFLLRLFYV